MKLSTDEFADEEKLQNYFTGDGELRTGTQQGVFVFNGHIAPKGLVRGETILFSYQNKLRYVAKAETGRKANTYREQAKYRHCFIVDLDSIRAADVSLEEVERRLRDEAGLQKSLAGRGWNIIPDSEQAEMVIADLSDAPTRIANDAPDGFPERKECVVHRFIRDTATSRQVKRL
ncbi:MAG TPA: hypothetical protein VGR14_19435, partial [Verrucomicrobiae bacterium]|nr:hypothetical protein [Verrucomicrobiae bacterium]